MKRRALGLYLASRKPLGTARAGRRLARETTEGVEDAELGHERLATGYAPRPKGPLLWLHVGSPAEAMGVPDLIARLREEREDLEVLVTLARFDKSNRLQRRLPPDVFVHLAPYDEGPLVEAFLSHWAPDVVVWADNQLSPVLLDAVGKREMPAYLIDARVPDRPGWKWMPGIRRALLQHFDHVLAGDGRAAEGLQGLGIAKDKIEVTGFLQESTAPLGCSPSERDEMAGLLAARPVWLAVGAAASEVTILVEAHRQAMRRAHRLLLVIVPEPIETGPMLAATLEGDGWVVAARSLNEDPEPEVEIFIADQPDELGLWYRLSPVTFMGATLVGGTGFGPRNPYEAAALGSAVLFGPNLGTWRESYERLRDAGAARAVSDKASLSRAVEYLLSPDKVAEMAAAAWEVTTSGAEATDRAVELVVEALDKAGV